MARQIKSRRRRTMPSSTRGRSTNNMAAQKRLVKLAAEINDNVTLVAIAQDRLNKKYDEAQKLMQKNKLSLLEVPDEGTHRFEGVKGNDKTTMDMSKFRRAVTPDDFMGVVNVTSVNAKKLLTGKQYEAMTTTIKGTMKPAVYKFTPIKGK